MTNRIAEESLSRHLPRIDRGVYWFGWIGGLFVLGAACLLVAGIIVLLSEGGSFQDFWELLLSCGYHVLIGWLFLKGRDAFAAIAALLREMDEVV